jgi:oligopeptidase B
MKAPQAPKRPFTITQHEHSREDPYFWLRDKNWQKIVAGDLNFSDPEVKKYIEEEIAYTTQMMLPHQELQKNLYREILGRIQEDDETCPIPKNDYFYYTRTIQGENYKRYCRKYQSLSAPEQVYFDTNIEASAHDLFMLKGLQTNKSNSHLLYAFNTSGSMEATLKLRDLQTGQDLAGQIENTTGSYNWVSDFEFYYVERDETARGKNLYRVDIRKGLEQRELLFSKPDEFNNMFMWCALSSDKKYCFITLSSGASSRIYAHKIGDKDFKFFVSGENDIRHSLDHWEEQFFILTNDGHKQNFQVFVCDKNNWQRQNWQLLISEREGLCLESIQIYAGKLVLEARNTEAALPQLLIWDLALKQEQAVSFQDEVYNVSLFGAYDHNSTVIRIHYESPVRPRQDIDLDLVSFEQNVLREQVVPNYNADNFVVERQYALAHDGEKIPLTIFKSKNFKKDAQAPAFIYGYGSYGHAYSEVFNIPIFSLVERGFVVCLAHIRGGSDKGERWYLDGKLNKKLNTFKDFISSCEFLIENQYTSKGLISANGGSAGGLLMGAVTNMRPDLFRAVVADVAFVDVISTISDDSLPLTPPEWEEWGNPIKNKTDYEYMLSYSPYDNVKAQDYPNMLYTSGISDEQVTYWEPTKMVAKLRAHKTDNNKLLLKMKMNAGHAGASKRYEWIEDKAFTYAFILSCYGDSQR